MGITKHIQELKLRVSAKRMFKALVLNLTPSHFPMPSRASSSSMETGGGTIRQTNLADGSHVKIRIEAVDIDNQVSKYTVIEGPMLGDKIESIHYEQKFEDSSDGGCVAKIVSEYHTKGDIQLKEEEVKAINDRALGFYTLSEEYLHANPNVCA
ncbi:hypothetical protein DH2020_043455 [Rehmannia glutinosa]|uniref:Bet v I/Major latex protein domain-containing protein n=1 Tax=Rehmannia glutinosa TaxID=99300 RepID=A0ABR0UKG5_REHGL